jgi:hypothetical protein
VLVKLTASIFRLGVVDEGGLQETFDFLRGNDEKGCAFAVHLSQDTTRFIGIILAGTKSSASNETLLAKCAAYQIVYDEEMAFQVLANGVSTVAAPSKGRLSCLLDIDCWKIQIEMYY